MITFKSIRYVNFQSVGNQGIKVSLDRSITTMISGGNGSGKSTLLEAVTYALFGKPLKKVNMAGLINTINGKNLVVEIEFTKNGTEYKIIRGQKPAKLELWVGDQLLDQSASVRDYQTKIEYVLGMDYKLFTQIVVLNKEKYVPFMDLDAASRRKVVEDILDISIFSSMNDILKEKSKMHSIKVNDSKFDRERLVERLKGKQRLLDESTKNATDLTDDLNAQIATIENDVNSKVQELSALESEVAEYSDAQELLNKLLAKKSECDQVSVKFNSNVSSLEKTISFYNDNDVCPTCSSTIADDVKAKHVNECTGKIADIRKHSKSLIDVYKKVIDDIAVQNERLQTKRRIETDIHVMNRSIDMLNAQIKNITRQIEDASKSNKLSDIQAEFDAVQLECNTHADALNALLAIDETYNSCKVLLRDDQIKASVVRDYIDFINTKVNEQLAAMEFYLNISLDENFNDTINAVNKKGFTYDNLSTGQKARVNLAIWLALIEVASIKNSIVTNILFLDEILEPIDATGVNLFMNLAKEKLPHKNTFVVTQRSDEFRDYFRSELKFKLVEGFTELI